MQAIIDSARKRALELRDKWAKALPRVRKTDPHEPMWIDRPDADRRLQLGNFDVVTRKALSDLMQNGLAVLPGNIPYEQCDALLADFRTFCAKNPDSSKFVDTHSLHDRLCNFHLVSEAARALSRNEEVRRVVRSAFGELECVAGSLYFERGSTQSVHRDSPAFFTQPVDYFFGVWHALEDIHPDSGALVYYPGGHRILPDKDFLGFGYSQMDEYFQRIIAGCVERGLPKQSFLAKKGDTLIWHPALPHGGGAIKEASRSRNSIVFHYIPAQSPLWGPHEFFGPQTVRERKPNMKLVALGGDLLGLDWGAPLFLKNVPHGNFKD